MVAVDGEYNYQADSENAGGNGGKRPGEYVVMSNTNYESPGGMGAASHCWYSQNDSVVVKINHYHKRGWRVESNAYVEWETTDRYTPYPYGGTVEPAVGTVLFQWVTYSNGQLA
jgi:hypothetical protein